MCEELSELESEPVCPAAKTGLSCLRIISHGPDFDLDPEDNMERSNRDWSGWPRLSSKKAAGSHATRGRFKAIFGLRPENDPENAVLAGLRSLKPRKNMPRNLEAGRG
jgi:hypothetical protein